MFRSSCEKKMSLAQKLKSDKSNNKDQSKQFVITVQNYCFPIIWYFLLKLLLTGHGQIAFPLWQNQYENYRNQTVIQLNSSTKFDPFRLYSPMWFLQQFTRQNFLFFPVRKNILKNHCGVKCIELPAGIQFLVSSQNFSDLGPPGCHGTIPYTLMKCKWDILSNT